MINVYVLTSKEASAKVDKRAKELKFHLEGGKCQVSDVLYEQPWELNLKPGDVVIFFSTQRSIVWGPLVDCLECWPDKAEMIFIGWQEKRLQSIWDEVAKLASTAALLLNNASQVISLIELFGPSDETRKALKKNRRALERLARFSSTSFLGENGQSASMAEVRKVAARIFSRAEKA